MGWVPEGTWKVELHFFKNNPRLWLASPEGWCLQLLGGGAVFVVWGVLWGFQVVPTLSRLGTSYPPSPSACPPPPVAPASGEGLVPASEPVARVAGRVPKTERHRSAPRIAGLSSGSALC